MSDTIICVENLSKKYIIGQQKQESYTALRDVIANGAKSIGSKLLKPLGKRMPEPAVEEFWA
ncbi:MAG: ABC transporter ATP-binding protein, partial [Cyanobacteriota bacterium]|nr:ABC transporter ATP-binding protein [Cyanobacteriota bacterium]